MCLLTERCITGCFLPSRMQMRRLSSWKVSNHPRQTTRKAGMLLPRNILLLRHGQSLGNVDESLFTRMPDWKIPLSDLGKVQARHQASEEILAIVKSTATPLIVYVSPYMRTKETLQELQSVLPNPFWFVREEPRLREQDFGNFQNASRISASKRERPQFGRFFYRFPNGESGADVFDRVSAFCATFRQDMEQINRLEQDAEWNLEDATALFVTHGITSRLFLMRWLHWSVDDFEELHNPPNCGLLHLKRREGTGDSYELSDESRRLIRAPGESHGALQLGRQLEQRSNCIRRPSSQRDAFAALAETAWGT